MSNKKEKAAGHAPHKIMLVSHSSELGGAELCFVETLKALSSTDKYELYAVFPGKGILNQLCIPYCKEIFICYLPWWIDEGTTYPFRKKIERFTNIMASVKQANKLLRATRPDVIITNTSSIPEFAFAAKITNISHCWFIHELVEEGLSCHFVFGKKLSKHIINWFSNVVISNSKFVYSYYIQYIQKERLAMLYQPVEIQTGALKKKSDNSQLILMIIGNISEFKGQREAILACQELNKRNIDFRLLIVGVKPSAYLEELKVLIGSEMKEKVALIPFSDNPQFYYEQSDIVLVCSNCESLGRISIEAMKMGLPVVASNQGGNLELIQEGFNGYTYQLGNSTDLANKILQLKNPKDRQQMGENGKKWAMNQFNMDTFTKELDDTLKELLQ